MMIIFLIGFLFLVPATCLGWLKIFYTVAFHFQGSDYAGLASNLVLLGCVLFFIFLVLGWFRTCKFFEAVALKNKTKKRVAAVIYEDRQAILGAHK
jgi:hypothetical protein